MDSGTSSRRSFELDNARMKETEKCMEKGGTRKRRKKISRKIYARKKEGKLIDRKRKKKGGTIILRN